MQTLVALTALAACARPPETPPPPPPDPPPQLEPPEVTEPPATDEPDEPTRERRHGAVAIVTPPDPPRHDTDGWGGESGERFGSAPFCLPVFPPSQPSYVRDGRRSLVRLRAATVVDGTGDTAQRLLAGRAAALRSCHLEAMEIEPTAAGDLRLRLQIGVSGGVLAVVVESSALPIEACARETALQWRFPKDDPATISATFELRTEPAPPERPAKPRCRE